MYRSTSTQMKSEFETACTFLNRWSFFITYLCVPVNSRRRKMVKTVRKLVYIGIVVGITLLHSYSFFAGDPSMQQEASEIQNAQNASAESDKASNNTENAENTHGDGNSDEDKKKEEEEKKEKEEAENKKNEEEERKRNEEDEKKNEEKKE